MSFSTMDYNAISNIKAFYENKTNTEVIEINNIDIEKLKKKMVDGISDVNSEMSREYLSKNVVKRESVSFSDDSNTSSVFERIIDQIRSGKSVSFISPTENPVFTPKSTNMS